MATSHDPSAAIVTLTVRVGRPGFCTVYVATYRLSRAAATRAASWPHGSVGPVGTGAVVGVSSGRMGGWEVQDARTAQPTAVVARRAVRRVRTRSLSPTDRPDRGIDSPGREGPPVPWSG